ncbi:NADH dehydrogenase [ubiquinone] 1 alpha subcomplex subunit 9, mitochondrial [Trichinella pseudospiralis]|uniref:NADH dehydrogenase [ubiquinone] 1 alpha subcomplex subunit 9, mitochondrial n=3 Tax=Trichinella pseudospiralis TaxID=6337 RepID=A0A0V1JHR9_TRIPS|nr:NADH dehydrogenase [ubiquinone] 1 alpha subcomplex subunit 9, mitochondrial [Trichinella pseudospiralis]KRZ45274.1 NADH dehydrogenase [ubiquinone] 1 alpha subcomplex subunit 9, mitochondrial [Trichinella pseudospiralis]
MLFVVTYLQSYMLRTISKKSVFPLISINSGRSSSSYDSSESEIDMPEVRRSSIHSFFQQGTGGRCSYSGDTCTVFGASGVIGTPFVNRIVKKGVQLVIPYRRDPHDYRHLRTCGELGQLYFFPYFLKDEDSIRTAVKYSNLVVNFIGADYETKNFSYYDLHVDCARRIARICREMGVKQLVHFSAMNANLEPKEIYIPGGSNYLKSKALGEIAVREEFPNAIIIRPGEVHCFADRFINLYLSALRRSIADEIALYAFGETTFKAPVYVSDIVSATIKVLFDPTAAGQTFELIGPYSYQFGELVDWMYNKAYRGIGTGYARRTPGICYTLKTFWLEMYARIFRYQPRWNWEQLERTEATSDVLTGCKTFEDLEIEPRCFEDSSFVTLQMYDYHAPFRTSPDKVEPEPPKRYQHLRKDAKESSSIREIPEVLLNPLQVFKPAF